MANALYGLGRQKFLEGSISWSSDTIKIMLIDTASYTINLTTHDFHDDIPGGAIVATSSALGSKTTTLGVADAADVTFTAVSGAQCSLIVGYKDTGVSATSPLIFAIDVATGLPVTPNGGDITVAWDSGANKIFKLFEGLSEEDKQLGLMGKLKDFLNGIRIPAFQNPNGLWIPAPRLIQSPTTGLF